MIRNSGTEKWILGVRAQYPVQYPHTQHHSAMLYPFPLPLGNGSCELHCLQLYWYFLCPITSKLDVNCQV